MSRRSIFLYALVFFLVHAPRVLGLSLIAAVGRGVQLGWENDLSTIVYIVVELFVEGARVAVLVLAVGGGHLEDGVRQLKSAFRLSKEQRDAAFTSMWEKAKAHWVVLVRDIVLFAVLAVGINALIGLVAETETAHVLLRGVSMLDHDAATLQRVAAFFLKNLTVIPMTIIFQYGIVRYLLGLEPFDQHASVKRRETA